MTYAPASKPKVEPAKNAPAPAAESPTPSGSPAYVQALMPGGMSVPDGVDGGMSYAPGLGPRVARGGMSLAPANKRVAPSGSPAYTQALMVPPSPAVDRGRSVDPRGDGSRAPMSDAPGAGPLMSYAPGAEPRMCYRDGAAPGTLPIDNRPDPASEPDPAAGAADSAPAAPAAPARRKGAGPAAKPAAKHAPEAEAADEAEVERDDLAAAPPPGAPMPAADPDAEQAMDSASTEPAPDVAETDEAAERDHDPQIVRARLETIATGVKVTGIHAQRDVEQGRDDAEVVLQDRATEASERVAAEVRRGLRFVGALFDAERKAWTAAFERGDRSVVGSKLRHQAFSWLRGIGAIAGISNAVSKARDDVEKSITTSIDKVDEIKRTHQGTVHDRTVSIAKQARDLGESKAVTYNDRDTSLRDEKRSAVRDMGDKFAKQVEEKEPESKQSIADGLAKLPGDLRAEGDKVKEQLEDPTPKVAPAVVEGIGAATGKLEEQAVPARAKLREAGRAAIAALTTGEQAARGRMNQIRAAAQGEIRRTLRRNRRALRRNAGRMIDELDGVTIGATARILESSRGSVKRARRFATWIEGKLRTGAARFVEALPGAVDQMAAPMFEIAADTAGRVDRLEGRLSASLVEQRAMLELRLDDALAQIDGMFAATLKVFTDVLEESQRKLDDKLTEIKSGLDTKFKDATTKADDAIGPKVKEAYDKVEEGLPELGKKMDKAVDKIDWDDRHPILAAIRDVASWIGGLVWSLIKLVFKLILALIVAIIAIIALVLLGLELAVAFLVVAIVFAVILVVQIGFATYERYKESKNKGLDRGFFANLGLGFSDVAGLTKMYLSFTADDLTPFERGEMFGEGVGDLAGVVLTVVGLKGSIKQVRLGADPIPYAGGRGMANMEGLAKFDRALRIQQGQMPRGVRARALFEGLWEAGGKTPDKVRDWAVEAPGRVREWAGEAPGRVRDWAVEAPGRVRDWAVEAPGRVRDWAVEAPGRVRDWAVEAPGRVRDWTVETRGRIKARNAREKPFSEGESTGGRTGNEGAGDPARSARERQQEQQRREREQREQARREQEERTRREEEQREQQEREQQERERAERERAERERAERERAEREQREQEQRERRERERAERERQERADAEAARAQRAREEREEVWQKTFEGKQHGRDMFMAAREQLAKADAMSAAEKVELFEAIAKEINKRDSTWQADRGPATDVTGEPLAGFFTGEQRPFGFAIDAKGDVWSTGDFTTSIRGIDRGTGGYIIDLAQWKKAGGPAPTGGGPGPTGGKPGPSSGGPKSGFEPPPKVGSRDTRGWSQSHADAADPHLPILEKGAKALERRSPEPLPELVHPELTPLQKQTLADFDTRLAELGKELADPELHTNFNTAKANRLADLQAEYARYQQSRDAVARGLEAARQARVKAQLARALEAMKQLREGMLGPEAPAREAAAGYEISPDAKAAIEASGRTEAEVRADLADYIRLTGEKPNVELGRTRTQPRANYDASKAGEPARINVGAEPKTKTIFHELAHDIEYQNPDISAASKAFRDARAQRMQGSTEAKPLSLTRPEYEAGEVGVDGGFVSEYTGKVYEGPATEVITTAIESFTNPQKMLDLFRRDPEHFIYILGVLAKLGGR